jgi:tRNA modification GTPase
VDVFAAVMTGPGVGAIATIQLFGASAETVLETVFRSIGAGGADFEVGRIVLGHIVDGAETIDQVTVGCEADREFAVHCHGNPLIVEAIMELLQRHGAELLPARQWHARVLAADVSKPAIAIEARVALTTVKTVEGARIIASQAEGGLGRLCGQWQAESMSLDRLKEQVTQILHDSDTAQLIISGCTIVLIGPPNTGKSTLLNVLAGREKAIVTDIEGTTRDWISAEIHIPPLAATVIDTAGLAGEMDGRIDRAAQARSLEMLQRADLVLLVLDGSCPGLAIPQHLVGQLADKTVVTVFNKADLPERLDATLLPPEFRDPVRISAQQTTGIDALIRTIHQTLGVVAVDPHTPIAFTDRQRTLLGRLQTVSLKTEADAIIAELLEGPVSV